MNRKPPASVFENIREDWHTYQGQISRQGLWVMWVYRFGQWRYTIQTRWLRLPFSFLYKVLFVFIQIITGVELPCEAKVGKRFLIEHAGCIVVSGDACFGNDVIIRQGVTVGLKNTGIRGSPTIGNRVDIGAGAKLLGPIHIGDDVAIGANAVVVRDIPENTIAVGIPAKIISKK